MEDRMKDTRSEIEQKKDFDKQVVDTTKFILTTTETLTPESLLGFCNV
jgi:hypothetical protein